MAVVPFLMRSCVGTRLGQAPLVYPLAAPVERKQESDGDLAKSPGMPLLSLWASNPETVTQLNIEQILANAGNGKLTDESNSSHELREYLSQVTSDKLSEYANHCLATSFQKSGLVLQDVVNELGRRLDYQVENGRYQGVVGGIGYDGIWSSPEGGNIVLEVKTTDAYRIPLDTISKYRAKLFEASKVSANASILIVVGREDTGELEAQVRGSRHAWDMRLISTDSLVTLVKLKESTEAGVTGTKIRSILIPMEFTRLDALVDVMFATAKDIETTVESEQPALAASGDDAEDNASGSAESNTSGFTDRQLLRSKRDAILMSFGDRSGIKFIKKSMALYWNSEHSYCVACTLSKRYTKKGTAPYWYAYHPNWDTFLADGTSGYLVLGCMDLDSAFAVSWNVIHSHLSDFDTTGEGTNMYWHLKILEPQPNVYVLQLPKTDKVLQLNSFMFPV